MRMVGTFQALYAGHRWSIACFDSLHLHILLSLA